MLCPFVWASQFSIVSGGRDLAVRQQGRATDGVARMARGALGVSRFPGAKESGAKPPHSKGAACLPRPVDTLLLALYYVPSVRTDPIGVFEGRLLGLVSECVVERKFFR